MGEVKPITEWRLYLHGQKLYTLCSPQACGANEENASVMDTKTVENNKKQSEAPERTKRTLQLRS